MVVTCNILSLCYYSWHHWWHWDFWVRLTVLTRWSHPSTSAWFHWILSSPFHGLCFMSLHSYVLNSD